MSVLPLRLCHAGMDDSTRLRFEDCLAELEPNDVCHITEEADAEAAFIDMDCDLGPYLLAAHRLLHPLRPLIVTRRPTGYRPDPLTIELPKPLHPDTLSAALSQVRELLPRHNAQQMAHALAPDADPLDSIPDEMPFDALRTTPRFVMPPAQEPARLLTQFEERLATLYVGSMPDVDLDDSTARAQIYYQPEHFLQGLVAQALDHARDIARPVCIEDSEGPAIYLDPRNGRAYSARSANALRALAQLPARGTTRIAPLHPRTPSVPAGLATRPLDEFEWELALWASRGRLPKGTDIDAPVRLRHWPNLNRLTLPPEAARIAGLWSRGPCSLRRTVAELGVPQRFVFALYSACAALGHVEGPTNQPPAQAAVPQPPENSTPTTSRGVLKRIIGRLMSFRPDAPPPGAQA